VRCRYSYLFGVFSEVKTTRTTFRFIATAVVIFERSHLPTAPQMGAVASVGIQMKRHQATIAFTSPSLCDIHGATGEQASEYRPL
jgi:hypothetical protein